MAHTNTIVFLLNFGFAFCLNQKVSFDIQQACYQAYNNVIRDIDGVISTMACSAICSADDCCSFLFDEVNQRCITFIYNVEGIQTGCDWKYGERDLDRCRPCSNCDPNNYYVSNLNTCDPGYAYNATHNMCKMCCTTYGTTFGPPGNNLLSGFNNENLYNITEQSCKEACIAATGYVCRSAEYHNETNKCHLSEETALTQPGSFASHSGYTHWTRNCA